MTYLTQSIIADDPYMRLRIASCAAQEGCTDVGIDPDIWTMEWRRVWASAPGWDGKWESAMAQQPPIPYPGQDPGVITDTDILNQIQNNMVPFIRISDNIPKVEPMPQAPNYPHTPPNASPPMEAKPKEK